MLRVLILGELVVESGDGTAAVPPGRPARALLGFLALRPGPHGRADLAARFWPDVLDESARTSLRTALADLRRALGPAADSHLLATREAVELTGAWTDAGAAAALAAEGRVEASLALWRGELLAGLEAGDWLTVAREEQRATRGALLARLTADAGAAGDHPVAVARARERVALDPLSEEAHRDLIERLAAAGDRAAAVTAYGRLCERLRVELGIAPSAVTRELAARVRGTGGEDHAAGAPEQTGPAPPHLTAGDAGAAPPLPTVFARHARSAFVGRDAQRARLLAALDGVRGGERRLVLVAGEPGIGKSRLVAETARRAHAAGATVLAGRCHEEPLGPFAPVVEALRPLGTLHPEPAADAGAARLRLFDEVEALLAAAAARRPVLLALDDLHWADHGTLRLVAHLAAAPEPAPLLLLGTYRHTELGRRHPLATVLADLRRERRGERLALSGLAPDAATRLIGGWVGTDAGPELARRVLAETEGNPFFIEEVLRDLVEAGALVRRDGRWQADRPLAVPESVREVIGRRVERLSDDAVAVLEVAAVHGREFALPPLTASGLFARETLLDGLEEAERAHLVRPLSGRDAGRWAFSHALVREALYDDLPSLRRARLHAAVADGLERAGGAAAEAAFHAYEAAALEGPERAVRLAETAADEALAGLAYEEAAAHLGRALQALGAAGPPLQRIDLLLARGDALARTAEPAAVTTFDAAAALARAEGDPERLGRAALGACGIGVSILALDLDRAARLEEAIAALGDGAPALRARLLARLAIELAYAPGRDRSGALSEAAVAAARATTDPGTLLAALNARHVALWHPEGLDERFAVAEEMVALAREHDRPEDELQGRNWRALDLWDRGDVEGFAAEVERHAALADALRLPRFRWYAPAWRAGLRILRGDHDVGPLIDEAAALGARAGDENAVLSVALLGFWMGLQAGDYPGFDLDFVEDKIANSPAAPAYLPVRAWIWAELGRVEEARAELERAAPRGFAGVLPRDLNLLSSIADWASVIAIVGDAGRAEQLYAIGLPFADRPVTAGRAFHFGGSMQHVLGLLAATGGRLADAVAHFEAAIDAEERIGARAWVVHTRGRLAETLAAAGDEARAAREADAAVAAAAHLGLPGAVPPGAARLAAARNAA